MAFNLHQEKCQTKKVDLRLVVNAGSILETDDQQGLAHLWSTCVLMEPNVFQNQLVDYLQYYLAAKM
jgi:zinc protease